MTPRAVNDGLRKLCACPRRIWAKCEHSWYLNFSWQGVPHRYSLDKLLKRPIRTKTDATTEADRIRDAIRDGTFNATTVAGPAVVPPTELTLEAFGDIFFQLCPKKKGKHKGKPRGEDDRGRLNRLYTLTGAQGVPLGEMPINAIGEPDIEAALRSLGDDVSASTWNKYVQLCQSLSKWGLKKKYLTHSWFTDDPDIRRADEGPSERHRRLEPDQVTEAGVTVQGDERRLLAAAPPRLQRLIIAALETCCRADELLQLQWRHVGPDWLQLPGANTKAGAVREIPISTRLRAVLEMARLDPAGKQFPADAHVFGNEVGEAAPFPRKAWETTVLKAHGHRPVWEPGKGRLTETCRAQLAAIDLTFHDLRHEAGSRLLEAGWPLHHVRDMLGHADISTTSRYLNAARFGLRESMRRAESAAVPGSNSGEQTVTLAKTLQKTESETPDPDPIDEGEKRRKVLIQ